MGMNKKVKWEDFVFKNSVVLWFLCSCVFILDFGLILELELVSLKFLIGLNRFGYMV